MSLLDWVWRPFADGDPALTGLMGRVAWLPAHDTADHSPASVPVIDHRLGIAVLIFGEADGLNTMSPAVHQSSHERITKYNDAVREATGWVEKRIGCR